MPTTPMTGSTSTTRATRSNRIREWTTFLLGLTTGFLFFAAFQYGKPTVFDVVHRIRMSHSVEARERAREASAIATIPVDTEDGTVSGSAFVRREGEGVAVDVKLQSTVPIEWEFSYNKNAWSLVRIERDGTAVSSFAANPGSIRGMQSGEGAATLVFEGYPTSAGSASLRIRNGGVTVFEGKPSRS